MTQGVLAVFERLGVSSPKGKESGEVVPLRGPTGEIRDAHGTFDEEHFNRGPGGGGGGGESHLGPKALPPLMRDGLPMEIGVTLPNILDWPANRTTSTISL